MRCGLALYGMAPTPALASTLAEATGGRRLEPVLSLRSRVTYVQDLAAGERPSYGRRRPVPCDTTVATVPIGYADGVSRRLFDQGGEVLIGGRRHPMAGVVTMDQIVVDCGPVGMARVAVGDEVVLIGRQGDQEITAGEWADLLGTISYEVVCAIGPRVPRIVHGGGPADGGGQRRTVAHCRRGRRRSEGRRGAAGPTLPWGPAGPDRPGGTMRRWRPRPTWPTSPVRPPAVPDVHCPPTGPRWSSVWAMPTPT